MAQLEYLTGTGQFPIVETFARELPRRTKIVCTLGPSTTTPERIAELVEAGMDVARLNMSHGTHDEHRARFEAVRAAADEAGRPVAIMADLCGPKIRVAKGFEARTVAVGDRVTLTQPGVDLPGAVPVTLDVLTAALQPGQPVLIEDGKIRLRATEVTSDRVETEVEIGGTIKEGKGVNLPETDLPIPALTAKDEEDLRFAAEIGVDLVALSFVRSAADVERLRSLLIELDSPALIVSKIEKAEAIADLDAVVAASDIVMVARGDLGVEMGIANVPVLQKRIIDTARAQGRAVITATQMLESMITSPVPTRAEASDVANAIVDGTSAVMLSAETAAGEYPIEAVRVLDEVARVVEPTLPFQAPEGPAPIERALVDTACEVAEKVDARVVAMRSRTGTSARRAARFRAHRSAFAACTNPVVYRQLAVEWGIVPCLVPAGASIEESWDLVIEALRERDLAAEGELVVLSALIDLRGDGRTISIALHRLGG